MISFVESCPFCGSGFVDVTKADEKTGERRAHCEDCESTGPSAHTAEGAIRFWNVRAPVATAAQETT